MREIEPEIELAVNDKLVEERKISDNLYATWSRFGLVEKLVFGFVTMFLMAAVGALIKLVIIK